MVTGDEVLWTCNETELLQLARAQGLPPLRRGMPREELIAIVAGEAMPRDEHVAATSFTRGKLQDFVTKHWGVVMSQLPGCDGKCRTFACSEGRHLLCFQPNQDAVQ